MAFSSRLFFLILSLVCALCSMGHSSPYSSCSQDEYSCNSPMKIGKEVEEWPEPAAEHEANTTSSLHNPDTKVTSTPRIWKTQTGLHYTTLFRHVHGVLNIIGWGTFMPTGIIIARYFREFPMSCDRWYSAHVVCQASGYIMGVVGWGFGISISNSSKRSHKPFLILGIIVIVLTSIQMFAICLKPKKESGWRRCWEIYHHLLGYVIIALIIADIFEGINAQRHPEKWRWAYVGILAVLAIVVAALEMHRWIKVKAFKQAMKLNANMYSPSA